MNNENILNQKCDEIAEHYLFAISTCIRKQTLEEKKACIYVLNNNYKKFINICIKNKRYER